MSKFDGTWHVQPFTQQTLDSIYKGGGASAAAGKQPAQQHTGGHNWLGSEYPPACGCLLGNQGLKHALQTFSKPAKGALSTAVNPVLCVCNPL